MQDKMYVKNITLLQKNSLIDKILHAVSFKEWSKTQFVASRNGSLVMNKNLIVWDNHGLICPETKHY